jgi:hypothetical protein
MPVTFKRLPRYVAPDNQEFNTLAEAMVHELETDADIKITKETAMMIVSEREKIMAILRQKERKNASTPKTPRKPRSDKGKKVAQRTDPEERTSIVAHTEVMKGK